MVFTPLPGGNPFEISVYPDQGASQSVISYDIARDFGLKINHKEKKTIEDAQHGKMDCTGSTDFKAEYEGSETLVKALVTKSLQNECLMGWRALQRLHILHENFPHSMKSSSVKTVACGKEEGVGRPPPPHRNVVVFLLDSFVLPPPRTRNRYPIHRHHRSPLLFLLHSYTEMSYVPSYHTSYTLLYFSCDWYFPRVERVACNSCTNRYSSVSTPNPHLPQRKDRT